MANRKVVKSIFSIDDVVQIKGFSDVFTLIAMDYLTTILKNKAVWLALNLNFKDNSCNIIFVEEELITLSDIKIDDINIKTATSVLQI